MYTKSLLVAGLATLASAHIKMSNPVPYGAATLNNSPLAADGSDFPCKQRAGVYDAAGASNVYAQGSSQQLKFIGSAVHGGGSCQVSITTDLKPNANSKWKVIKSIEGGCPAKDTVGNLPDNAAGAVPFTYGYTIPDELAAGNYTIAWTWQNKVGNRELYMNCAPLQVTGDKADDSLLDSLPDMFVANIGNNCETLQNSDLLYPNPGKDVDRFNGATSAFKDPVGPGCAKATGGSGGGNNGGGNSPAPTTTEASSQPSAPAQQPSVPGAQPSEQPDNSTPAPEAPSGGSSSSPSGGFAAGTACDAEGDWNCVGGSAFQRCASGSWSTVMALAQGVNCSGGQSAVLNMAAAKGKRSLRRASRII
ncbi:hypothetical protein NLU13_9480 [Sarocladium strictum]|uniref:Uncharacterized protein n=1 Tax=Sarocladium strictum TaxID=5046 RepID=A0AA39L4G5_SARSR|nr:hypothetical protein NLU13_9480 [Sarocladium strictum]